jgi:hypothetical protein
VLRTGIFRYFNQRPAQVAFVLCLLATATAQVGVTPAFGGLTNEGRILAVSQSTKSASQLRREGQTSIRYLDQSFAAEEFDLASDHD